MAWLQEKLHGALPILVGCEICGLIRLCAWFCWRWVRAWQVVLSLIGSCLAAERMHNSEVPLTLATGTNGSDEGAEIGESEAFYRHISPGYVSWVGQVTC